MSTLRELALQQVAPRLLEVLRRQGLARLTEFQIEAVDNGIVRGASQVLITHDYNEGYVIGEIALLNQVASNHRAKALVLCPNPHQAEKRFKSLSQKCRKLGIEAKAVIRRRKAINHAKMITGKPVAIANTNGKYKPEALETVIGINTPKYRTPL